MKHFDTIGRTSIWGRAAFCALGAAFLLLVSQPTIARSFLPFQAALHERLLPLALVGMAVFYLLVGLGRLSRRAGYLVGLVESLFGGSFLAFRLILGGEVEGMAALWILVSLLFATGMAVGWWSARGEARGRGSRVVVGLFTAYLVFGYGLYPLSYLVGLFMRPAVQISDLTPAPPFERDRREITGVPHAAFYGETHGHSHFSIDARLFGARPPEEYFLYARDVAGLDFAALTDHDTPNGISDNLEAWHHVCRVTERFNEPRRFVTFQALEWTSGEGHAELLRHWTGQPQERFLDNDTIFGHRNVIFPDDRVPAVPFSHGDPACVKPECLWQQMRPWNAIGIPHHPMGGPVPAFKWEHFDGELEPLVELYSTHGNSEAADAPYRIYNPYLKGEASLHSVRYALSLGYRFGFIGATDSHAGWAGNDTTRPDASIPETMTEWVREVYGGAPVKGGGLMGVYARELTRSSLWEAFLARRTFATTGPRMAVALWGNDVFMGSVGTVAANEAITLRGEVVGTKPLSQIEIIHNGVVTRTVFGNGTNRLAFTIDGIEPSREEDYFYARVTQSDGEMAWSSPVWLAVSK